MKKKELTPEEIQQKEYVKKHNSAMRRLATKVKNSCKDMGLSCIKLQLEFLKTKKTVLPMDILSQEDTIICFENGIKLYEESI